MEEPNQRLQRAFEKHFPDCKAEFEAMEDLKVRWVRDSE